MTEIRHNRPDAFALFKEHLDDLVAEAKQYLDGAPVENDQQADDVSRLINMIGKAAKDADAARKEEKRPFDEGAKAVQAKWTPVIDVAHWATAAAKQALTPYLERKDAELREREAAAKREAEEKAEQARQMLASAQGNVSARIDAETMLKAADEADRRAATAAKAKAHGKGGERTIALRTSYSAEIADFVEFARWCWHNRRSEIEATLQQIADREAKQGPRPIPGLVIHTNRNAA